MRNALVRRLICVYYIHFSKIVKYIFFPKPPELLSDMHKMFNFQKVYCIF